MKRIYYLSTCDTCKRILKGLKLLSDVELIDIKQTNIDAPTLDWLKEKTGSYEGLFSKKAQKFRGQGLHEKTLSENDYRNLMLEEYTFLKRPFIIYNEEVWIGNAKTEVEAATQFFNAL